MVKKAGNKKVLVGGCFDLLHYGHVLFLKKAKECGDYLIVALESDEFINKHKNRKPVHSQRQRAEILNELTCVDEVLLMPYLSSDKEYEAYVKKIHPDIIAVTEGDPQMENKKKQAMIVGGKLEIVSSLIADFSTKEIRNKLFDI